MMRVAIHQPHYLPWLPYMQKIAACDLFILLDDAAYTKNGWQNRNKIKCAGGWMYLTAPVQATLNQPICEVRLPPGNWREKHLRALQTNYSRAPYFAQHAPFFTETYQQEWTSLQALNETILRYCMHQIGLQTPIVRSSGLNVPGAATERLIDLCRAVGASCYYSGAYAVHAYLDTDLFQRAGIGLELQSWHCPEYPQQFPKEGFIPDLSVVDLLFNAGPDGLAVLQRGGIS